MMHFRQSTRSQLPAYQYAYGDKTASGVCLQNVTDYSPFGAALDGRTMQGDAYRYQFNGMECDPEVKGEGNSYTTEFRQYDPRLGRWLSLDPAMAKYPGQSPYVAFNNNPIFYTDPFGDDPPEGFQSVNGQGGNVSIPQSSTTTYGTGTATDGKETWEVENVLTSFTIGSKTFSAQYDKAGAFTGYFNGTSKYENPDIKIASGGFTGTDLANMKVTFNVTNVPADGLQMVQPLVYSGLTASAQASNSSMSFNSDGLITGQYYFSNGTVKMAGEVDGAKGSFFSFQNGGAAANAAGPYYNSTAELASASYANMTWNGTSGSITAFDGVSARVEQKVMTFRTIIVAVNYMGTGKDVAIGTYEWGWDNYGTTPIHGATPSLKGNNPTTRDMQIIQHYYPTYDFFK